jgi:hypothetical protein
MDRGLCRLDSAAAAMVARELTDKGDDVMPDHPAIAAGRAAVITGGASGIGLAAAARGAAPGR